MTFESFLSSRLDTRLRKRRLMVMHDSDGRYRQLALSMADELTTVLDCGVDLLEAREQGTSCL